MYKSSRIAEDMLWHYRDRVKDGILRHPADAKACKNFDEQNLHFASEARNVRLGLSSDGFNPFRVMSTTHSKHVLLIPYNLPLWLCLKQSLIILCMIIPRGKAPGMDIDVYLQPLIKKLSQLWNGVDAFDAHTQRQIAKCMGFFTLLANFLHMQTHLGRGLKLALLAHLELEVNIRCG